MIAAALALILLVDGKAIERRRGLILGWALIGLTLIASTGRAGWAPEIPQPHPITAAPAKP
jgi:hypothetical protein